MKMKGGEKKKKRRDNGKRKYMNVYSQTIRTYKSERERERRFNFAGMQKKEEKEETGQH